MNQDKLVDILTQVMPEIVETKDPEKVLLKTASKHNMYPAQLEKLGHAFNQMKTIVGLEKQANRGDSFTLLNVPGMVQKYASYDPHKKLTDKDKKVHKVVDNIYKAASTDPYYWLAQYSDDNIKYANLQASAYKTDDPNVQQIVSEMFKDPMAKNLQADDFAKEVQKRYDARHGGVAAIQKTASSINDVHTLPTRKTQDLRKLSELFNMDVEAVNDNMSYEIKSASENKVTALDRYKDMVVHLNSAEKQANALKANVLDEMEQCAIKFANYLRKNGPECWAEMVEDTVDHFGEKCASAIDNLENYMEVNHVPYYVADLTKRACTPWLIKDRHNCWDVMGRVIELSDLHKEASAALERIENDREHARMNIDMLAKAAAAPRPNGPANPSPAGSSPSGPSKPAPLPNVSFAPFTPIDTSRKMQGYAKELANAVISPSNVQQKVEEAKADAASSSALQQLILNDPILQEADPTRVQAIFDTIASVSPSFAKDRNMMATALKEAIQYDAVPINMLKDISDFEKNIVQTAKYRNEL